MNLILLLLILILLAPALGLYVVVGTLGLILKILLILFIVSLIVNLFNGNRSFWF